LGLQAGDVITNVNNQPVHSGADLVKPDRPEPPIGQSVQIRYVRNKEAKDVTITVADRTKIFPQSAQNDEEQPDQDEEPRTVWPARGRAHIGSGAQTGYGRDRGCRRDRS